MIFLNLTLIIIITSVCVLLVKHLLRKSLRIEKEKRNFFSYNHINATHRKVDWGLRIVSLLIYLGMIFYVSNEEFNLYILLAALFTFYTSEYLVRAYFEWKHTDNPKQSILTLSEMTIITIAVVTVIQFDLLPLGA